MTILPKRPSGRLFLACPRCSFFLAGYRLVNSDLDHAIEKIDNNWLDLTWNSESRKLVQKVYGSHIDLELDHFEGVCRDCQRAYVYSSAEEDNTKDSFLVELFPG